MTSANKAPIRLSGFHESKLYVDELPPIPIRVKRLTEDQTTRFIASAELLNEPPSFRQLAGRQPDGPEQEKDANDRYVIPEAQIRRRRIDELAGEAQKIFQAAAKEDEEFARAFMREVIPQLVSVPPGVFIVDEVEITTGAQLLDVFSARGDVLRQVVQIIWAENTLNENKKKAWKLLSGLQHSSNALHLEADGRALERIAASVGTKDFAAIAAAMGSIVDPSGSEAGISSSTRARSASSAATTAAGKRSSSPRTRSRSASRRRGGR